MFFYTLVLRKKRVLYKEQYLFMQNIFYMMSALIGLSTKFNTKRSKYFGHYGSECLGGSLVHMAKFRILVQLDKFSHNKNRFFMKSM